MIKTPKVNISQLLSELKTLFKFHQIPHPFYCSGILTRSWLKILLSLLQVSGHFFIFVSVFDPDAFSKV